MSEPQVPTHPLFILNERGNTIEVITALPPDVSGYATVQELGTTLARVNSVDTNVTIKYNEIVATGIGVQANADAALASELAAYASAVASEASRQVSDASAAEAVVSEANALSSETNAYNHMISVQNIFDSFDDRYLGSKTADPLVDNDGNPLVIGQLYWNSVDTELKFYNGTVWEAPAAQAATSATNAYNSEQAAAASEANALASEQAAANSETASASSETASANSAAASEASRVVSDARATDSNTSAIASEASRQASDTSAAAALASEQAAAASESASATSETNAGASETASANSAAASEASRQASTTSATNSEASRQASDASAAAALVSENNSASSENLAYRWANEAEDVNVTGVEKSAYHWAKYAEERAVGSLKYMGGYDAGLGAPVGPNALGDYYKITAAGSFGGHTFAIGDSAIFNDPGWDKIDSTDQVTSVAGRLGAIVLTSADLTDWASYGKHLYGGELYVDGFMRSNQSGFGLYNATTGAYFYSVSSSGYTIRSNEGTVASLTLNTSDNVTRGYLYSESNNNIGLLDAGGSWAIKHTNDVGTSFYDSDGTGRFYVGQGVVTGEFGTVQTTLDGKGNYGGYSIGGYWNFMAYVDGSAMGLYNDADNQWSLYTTRNGGVNLYHAGVSRIGTASDGADIAGSLRASSMVRASGWYTGGAGPAMELGVSGGIAYVHGYDRTLNTYLPVQIDALSINFNPTASSDVTVDNNKVWHAGNDGAGSGLDADLLDGFHAQELNVASSVVARTAGSYIYANWFTSDAAGYGVYNSATGFHLISQSATKTDLRAGSSTANELSLTDNTGLSFGALYGDSNLDFGFLDRSRNWAIRHRHNGWTDFLDNNALRARINASGLTLYGSGGVWAQGASAQMVGGFGATTTSGTLDWNHADNARSGNGYALLQGSATNGPNFGSYFHPFSFEYTSKDGSGNLTQLAIGYNTNQMGMRHRYEGIWAPWARFLTTDDEGAGNGLDADTVDGAHHHQISAGQRFTHAQHPDFNTFLSTDYFGIHHVVGTALNAPTSGGTEFYHQRWALGSEYNNYSMQVAIPRNTANPYINIRYEEAGVAGAWNKISAGYADNAGLLAGYAPSVHEAANTIVQRDANGYIQNSYFNMSADTNPAVPGRVVIEHSSDGFLRYQNWSDFVANVTTAHNHNAQYLGINAKAADSNLLDGLDSTQFTRAGTQSDWNSVGAIANVVGMLAWKKWGNAHVIFDASESTSPSGTVVSPSDADIEWVATNPTLMGWNNASTYGVRVDSAKYISNADKTKALRMESVTTYGQATLSGSKSGYCGLVLDVDGTNRTTVMASADGGCGFYNEPLGIWPLHVNAARDVNILGHLRSGTAFAGSSGSVRLTDGLILKWVHIAVGDVVNSTEASFNWPGGAFPTTCLNANASLVTNDGPNSYATASARWWNNSQGAYAIHEWTGLVQDVGVTVWGIGY